MREGGLLSAAVVAAVVVVAAASLLQICPGMAEGESGLEFQPQPEIWIRGPGKVAASPSSHCPLTHCRLSFVLPAKAGIHRLDRRQEGEVLRRGAPAGSLSLPQHKTPCVKAGQSKMLLHKRVGPSLNSSFNKLDSCMDLEYTRGMPRQAA